ncbi:MAG: 1,4-dihydroxy-2-naphthoyl-CoA hydrolase [bacterium]|nr:1,4-dihydroxy-2-naphthoyl-CoA hydrolase [bacterium]
MAYEFRYERRIEFSDTDMAGIVHFANFFKFMEAAEHAFYLSLGFSVHDLMGGRVVTWPRVAAECRYRHPLRFEDLIEVHLLVKEKRRKSIRYLFLFHKVGEEPRCEYARGSITVVCAGQEAPGMPYKAIEIPEAIGSKIETAPEAVLAALEHEEK